jgi:ABC-type oligopeptide transport system substrate-binding subunit/predicted Ser/Thr protein kinase
MSVFALLRPGDPDHLGPYRLTGRLGDGGQGVVYVGEGADGRPVAIKVLHARFTHDPRARSRFAAEVEAAQRVASFCTARVLDAEVEGDLPYIVSEFVDGRSLQEVVQSEGPRSGSALDRVAVGTVTALTAIHQVGIVHRDFKPANVLMARNGPRVIDFGIARDLEAAGTTTGTSVGTPAFMAPEQIAGGAVGPEADVFAWGCTVAYAAAGRPPFGIDSIPAVMHRILNLEPDLSGLEGRLRDVVAACLVKDPSRRPPARQALMWLLGRTGAAPMEAHPDLLSEGAALAQNALAPSRGGLPPPAPGPGPSSPGSYPGPGPYPGSVPQWVPAGPGPYPGAQQGPATYPAWPRRPGGSRSRRGLFLAVGAGVTALVVAGVAIAVMVQGGDDPSPVPTGVVTGGGREGGTFRMAFDTYELSAIDPSHIAQSPEGFVAKQLYTGLTQTQPDGTVQRKLATSITPDANCTNWQIKVKIGTTFSDGQPVNASSFVLGWTRAVRAWQSVENTSYLFENIKGYDDIEGKKATTLSGVQAVGADGLKVALVAPDCDFDKRLSNPAFAPLPPQAGDPENKAFNSRPVGNGPFKIASYQPKTKLVLVRNDTWGFGRAKLDEVDMNLAADSSSIVQQFQNGTIDWAPLLRDQLAQNANPTRGQLITGESNGVDYLTSITDKPPFNSPDARLAISYALDRKKLSQLLYAGLQAPARSIVPPSIPGYPKEGGCPSCEGQDLEKAKQHAQKAGLGTGAHITLAFLNNPTGVKMATLIQQQLRDGLGWNLTLQPSTWSTYYPALAGKSSSGLYLQAWAGTDTPAAGDFLDQQLNGSHLATDSAGELLGADYSRYHNPQFDQLISKAAATVDAKTRDDLVHQAEGVALGDMPIIPLIYFTPVRLADTTKFIRPQLDPDGDLVLSAEALK